MNHPPIPPNCEFFSGGKVDGAEWFRNYQSAVYIDVHLGSGHAMSLDPEDFSARKIISAVARIAWMDEAQRRIDASECSKYRMTTNGQLVDDECFVNSAAWKEWGQIK